MDHNLTTSFNHRFEPMWWQVKTKHIMKLQA
jgi:hypothetical protein